MALRLGTRRFAPSLLGILLTIVGVAIGIRLGVWQLARADEKRALLEQFAVGQNATVDLNSTDTATLPRYQSVSATGRYDSGHQVLLDNMPSSTGKAGFRVLTPFEVAAGRWVLVDRGWVAIGGDRSVLPTVTVDSSQRAISGRLDDLPQPGMRLAEEVVTTSTWPHVLNFPQLSLLERVLERKLESRIVLLDAQQGDGFERVWTMRTGFGPERHLAYAVQWFALAAAMFIVFLVISFKPKATS